MLERRMTLPTDQLVQTVADRPAHKGGSQDDSRLIGGNEDVLDVRERRQGVRTQLPAEA